MTKERLAVIYQMKSEDYARHASDARDRYAAYSSMPRLVRWLHGPSPDLSHWETLSTLAAAYACTARLLMGHEA